MKEKSTNQLFGRKRAIIVIVVILVIFAVGFEIANRTPRGSSRSPGNDFSASVSEYVDIGTIGKKIGEFGVAVRDALLDIPAALQEFNNSIDGATGINVGHILGAVTRFALDAARLAFEVAGSLAAAIGQQGR